MRSPGGLLKHYSNITSPHPHTGPYWTPPSPAFKFTSLADKQGHMASLYQTLGAKHVRQQTVWCPSAYLQPVIKITVSLLPHCLQHLQISSVYYMFSYLFIYYCTALNTTQKFLLISGCCKWVVKLNSIIWRQIQEPPSYNSFIWFFFPLICALTHPGLIYTYLPLVAIPRSKKSTSETLNQENRHVLSAALQKRVGMPSGTLCPC